MKHIMCVLVVVLLSFEAMAKIKVVDGDSLEIDGLRIRLQGIDSPEYKQRCRDADGVEYDCHEQAFEYLRKVVASGKLECKKEGIDRYKRQLSTCYVGQTNVNLSMLRAGWAVVYRSDNRDYIMAEEKARNNELGLWQGKFMRPEFFRVLNR